MCIFSTLINGEITLKSSDRIWGINFMPLLSPSPPLIFSYLQAFIYDFLWWWACSWLIFISNHISSIPLPLIFKKKMTPLMKKIQGLQVPHGAMSCGIRAFSSRWCSFASSIFLLSEFSLIPCSSSYSPCISSIFLWFGAA